MNKKTFCEKFLEELNLCRSNPGNYSEKVRNHMNFISHDIRSDKTDKFVYCKEGCPTIPLKRGIEAFEECIEILENCPSRDELEFAPDLNLLIPDDKNYWTNSEYLVNLISLKKSDLKNSQINAFHFDIGSSDAESSLILQLVDDNSFNGIRRLNLLNAKYKYIGISHKVTSSVSCSYFFFSDVISQSNN